MILDTIYYILHITYQYYIIKYYPFSVTDALEAKSLSYKPNHIDIFVASWGPHDNGETVKGPGPLTLKALYNGIKNGRHGKGTIFVWASGNGGQNMDDCNCDGYASSIYTISVSSVTRSGKLPGHTEACSSTLVSTYR